MKMHQVGDTCFAAINEKNRVWTSFRNGFGGLYFAIGVFLGMMGASAQSDPFDTSDSSTGHDSPIQQALADTSEDFEDWGTEPLRIASTDPSNQENGDYFWRKETMPPRVRLHRLKCRPIPNSASPSPASGNRSSYGEDSESSIAASTATISMQACGTPGFISDSRERRLPMIVAKTSWR